MRQNLIATELQLQHECVTVAKLLGERAHMKDTHEDDSPILDAPPPGRGARRGPRRTAQRLGIGPDFEFDYKDPQTLSYFISDRGKIVPRRVSGLSARQQRSLALAIKRARGIALLPYTKGTP